MHTLYQLVPEVPWNTGAIVRLHVKKSRLRGVGNLRGELNSDQKGWVTPEICHSPEEYTLETPQRPSLAKDERVEKRTGIGFYAQLYKLGI